MGQSEIKAQIAAIIAATGVEKVYTRERFSTSWSDFLALFQDSGGKINGYTISRMAKARQSVTAGQAEAAQVFVVRGYYGFQDAADSEAVFQGQLDAIDEALLANETINDTCETTHPDWGPMNGAVGLQMDVVDVRSFGTVLCHYFEGRICAINLEDM